VGRKRAGTARKLIVVFVACAAALVVWMAGCNKIASTFRSLTRNKSNKKEHLAHNAPKRVLPGPKLAIILDDMGSDQEAAEEVFGMGEPLTISVLPFHAHSTEIAEEAKRRGFEVMLHLPMEAMGSGKPEGQQLHPGMSEGEVAQDLRGMLANVPTAAGVNNHEGSLATSDAKLMAELMPLLKQRSLYFVDSRTTAATVAFETAQKTGLRCGFRNVPFLDDVQDVAAIRKELEGAIRGAEEKGEAIAIGHPHKETIEALKEILPQAETQGVHLVFVSEIVR